MSVDLLEEKINHEEDIGKDHGGGKDGNHDVVRSENDEFVGEYIMRKKM